MPSLADVAACWRSLPPDVAVVVACLDQEDRWARGERIWAEEYLALLPSIAESPDDALALVQGEIKQRAATGEICSITEYSRRFPVLADLLVIYGDLACERTDGATCDLPLTQPLTLPSIPGYVDLVLVRRGGMGVIYKARDERSGEPVAIKLLADDAAPPEVIVRFLQEREILARLSHPNIVRFLAAGTADRRPYLVSEWLPGGTLADRGRGCPQRYEQAATTIATIARAISYAHALGIIHRDLKPTNVLLTTDGVPKVADFGVARLLFTGGSVSASGQLIGTLRYMPPEQVEGRHRVVGPPTDVYALGAILYELLTGSPPFSGRAIFPLVDAITKHHPRPVQELAPGVPAELAAVCLRCLAKRPEDRYQTADALRLAIEEALLNSGGVPHNHSDS